MDNFLTYALVGPNSAPILAWRPWIAQQGSLEWFTEAKAAQAALQQSPLPQLLMLEVTYDPEGCLSLYQALRKDPQGQATIVICINPAQSPFEAHLEADPALFALDTRDLQSSIGAYLRLALSLSQHHQRLLNLQRTTQENKCRLTLGAVTEGIAHNMNNLLGVVMGYLDLMKIALQKPEKILKSIGMIEQSLTRMTFIIRQLSLIAQVRPPAQSQILLKDLVESCLSAFHHEAGENVPVQLHYASEPEGLVVTNPSLISEAVSKLLMNAWESYPETTLKKDRLIQMTAQISPLEPFGKELRLTVEDAGSGIAPEVKQTLFEPFVTTKVSVGRGMGLPIARHNIKSLGGLLTLEPRKESAGVCARITQPFIEGLSSGIMIG